MTVPTSPTYSVAATAAFTNAFKALLDSGAGAAYVTARSATGVLLAQFALTDPCGSVSGTTGQLTCTPAGGATAAADGRVAYGELCDSTGVVHLALPALAGTVPVRGFLVVNSLDLLGGAPVSLASVVIG